MELSELSTLQITTRVVGFTRTHVMMLHSKFCAVQRVLLDKTTKRILLINIHKKVAGYCSLMNINEQNSFCCFVQQNTLDGTKLAVKHHNVRPRKANDSCRNLQSTKLTQLHERCTNFFHKITRRVALASQ